MRSAALSLLGITVLLLFLSHTFFFPAPAAAPVVHPKVSLLHGGHIPPEPDHRTKTKAPPSASPAAASAAGTPAAADSRSTPPTVGATGTGAPGLGGHGPFGPESVAPYMPHGQEDRRCVPRREQALPSRPLNLTVPADSAEWPINCASFDGAAELCAAVKTAAVRREVRREVMVGVANSNVQGQLAKWIEANRRAGISNMLIVAIDERLPQWLESQKVACWPRPDKALGSHKISAQKFKFVRSFLTVGASVLMTDIDVVYLQNPFDHLWRDADIEGTTDGWDDGSAYGWLEQLDDPSLGAYGRFRPAMRITAWNSEAEHAWNSGLWYAAATHASLRLMTILAYRMEHEPNTWDQAAFGEEVARPARDGHHAAGIVKRALSYWCFANSKTVFRRLRAEAGSTHRPVVVHANYHQPKQPRMDAVYDRWHLGQADALGRFSTEPTAVVPAPELEVNSLHSINDGFVSGSDTRNALAAVKGGGCRPQPSLHGVRVSVAVLPVKACAPADAVCSAASDVAVRRGSSPPELLLLVVGSSEAEPARLFLQSASAAGVKNVLVACDGLVAALQGQGVTVVDASSDVPADASAASRVARLRWALVRRLVEHGYGVLSAAAPTHFVSDPFDALYRDADVEAMTVGYNHVIDDPSMGVHALLPRLAHRGVRAAPLLRDADGGERKARAPHGGAARHRRLGGSGARRRGGRRQRV
ncbi:hypothetical protein EMIHUDRAFT_469365 [Emiliania huxleyi CCMP1516]|uniref:Nucleotide-diphospho-sugar transferase domain-containing protein n=2 Tax=Emiliania huxleyi TaxID=2903 RepID=A0A0D3JL61_EMIH1|nr:hypothetical protein EMIHUDRAFT_469365 [Emiliania huxleyi CCMP1516]EOD24246.1 hypothetical protein EMIHUDRAFT_469365 [Emiliania huxleyi CCMP1516]|eukprot:XP_005776675.1 hypothetical protein EMIHUDRAFT_469365 [Emiliania huxleyi CCMP1516]